MVSSFSFWRFPLNFCWSCLTFGWMACISRMDRICLIPSGTRSSRMASVNRMMATP
jgi:hypothetical protein